VTSSTADLLDVLWIQRQLYFAHQFLFTLDAQSQLSMTVCTLENVND
jgi:hypothetical protein